MHITEIDNIIIISPYASLDIDMSILLRYKITELFTENFHKDLIINLLNADYICSTGLNVIMSTKKLLNESGKQLKICHANEEIMEIFQIVKLDDYLDIYETEAEARISCETTST